MKTNVDHYQLKWNEYYVRYEKHPLGQKLAEKKKELVKVEEQLKIYQSELRQGQADLFRMKCERARRNSEDVFQHLEKFVLTLASIKVETNKCLVDIALTKQEVGHISQVINLHKHTRENYKVLRPSSQMEIVTDNEPSHMKIIKNNVVSQMEIVTDNERFHMEIVKDNLIGQMEFAKDCKLKAMNEEKELGQSSVFIDNGKCIDTTGTKQCQSLSYTQHVNKPKLTKENIFQLFIPQLPLSQETKTKTYSIKSLPQEQDLKEVSDGRFSSSKVDEDKVRLSESCENRDNISKIINTYLTPFLNSNNYETPKCTKNTADIIHENQDNEEQVSKAKGDITSSPHSPLNFMKCQEILNQLKKSPGFVYKSRNMIQQDEKCKTQNIKNVPSSFVNSLAGINQFQTEVRQLDLEPSDRFEESYQRSSDKLGSVSTAQEETGKLSGSHFVTDCQSLNLTTAKETLSVTNKATFPQKLSSAVRDSPISSQQNRPANDAESPNELDMFRVVMFRHQNYEDTPSSLTPELRRHTLELDTRTTKTHPRVRHQNYEDTPSTSFFHLHQTHLWFLISEVQKQPRRLTFWFHKPVILDAGFVWKWRRFTWFFTSTQR
ncbi:uncharacterized protein LOC143244027 [Tachypleus tridentatus]|uniref:uncharacterized protein LOC143244027 n=1 Tax=Tachypleus tridentatus TaxID=6853 RepID=UPI003FD40D71